MATVPLSRRRRARSGATGHTAAESADRSSATVVYAGLASALLAVPVAVVGTAMGPYDDVKAWALVILAGATGLASLIERAGNARSPDDVPDRAARGIAAIVAAYFLWWVVTTIFSVAPWQSLLGNFGRGLGLLTVGSAILLYPVVASSCRSPRAVSAVIDAALLGSAPVCLVAIAQALGWDPLPKSWDPSVASLTVRSTFGQHIFLGSYLVLLIPLAVARLESGLRERVAAGAEPGASRWRPDLVSVLWTAGAFGLLASGSRWDLAWWLLVPWGLAGGIGCAWVLARSGRATALLSVPAIAGLVVVQVGVVLVSQARGAFFGMLAGLTVTACALLARRRAWRAVAAVAAALVLIALVIALLNLRGSPLERFRAAPLLSRLSHIAEVHRGTEGWVRLQIWRGTLEGWRRQAAGEQLILGTSPRARTFVGYGLETQLVSLERLALPWLGVLRARGQGWGAQYVVDRAHNIVLDHLVTAGVIGVGLWALATGSLLAMGILRARTAASASEFAVRIGAVGALAGSLVDQQVGIAAPMPLALFWVAGALCAMPSWSRSAARPARRRTRAWWIAVPVALAALVGVAWLETRWLLASIAYAEGTRSSIAGRPADAYARFERAGALVPWLALPAEAIAYTGLRLAAAEPVQERRLERLREADAALARVRRGPGLGAGYWALAGQVAFARVRAGERGQLEASLDAFDHAARLRPGDGQLLTQFAWALLEARDAARARAIAERATIDSRRRDAWLAWALLARANRALGDDPEAERAAAKARTVAPAEARQILESILTAG